MLAASSQVSLKGNTTILPWSSLLDVHSKLENKTEYLIHSLILPGLPELGDILLRKFKWGRQFFEMNRGLLDVYAACTTAADVIAAQEDYLKQLREEDLEERQKGG